MQRALITGITGQDGTYLAEHLIGLGYEVYGVIRGQNNPKRAWVEALLPAVHLLEADLDDLSSLIAALDQARPREVYNLAAISFVPLSWKQPEKTGNVTGLGALRLLEAIRKVDPSIRFYQASSSEMFGKVREVPQRETTPFYPRSPYGVAKVYAHYLTVNYRESYDLFACSGILFNHGSPRRGPEFVERKISLAAARIQLGLQEHLELGNLDAQRDWGFAGDYVRAMHAMLQADTPGDYVVATGEAHSVRECAELAFARVGLDWRDHVRVSDSLFRPAEVDHLIGDSTKARTELGWRPSIDFKGLVELMVDVDLAEQAARAGLLSAT